MTPGTLKLGNLILEYYQIKTGNLKLWSFEATKCGKSFQISTQKLEACRFEIRKFKNFISENLKASILKTSKIYK